jgi:hypothetical protein
VRLGLINVSMCYIVINRTANVEVPSNTGDFNLMSRCAEELRYSPTVTVLVLFMSGVQLVLMRLLGEYRGRICAEVSRSQHGPDDCSV